MGKIICIMGKSGTGKDTVFRALLRDERLGLKGVVTYTTRPRRAGETEGAEYHFISEEQLAAFKKSRKVIELRRYHTVRGVWYYCTIDDDSLDIGTGNYLMIVTLESYQSLCRYFGKENIVPVLLNVEDGIRLQRALDRERMQKHPDYEELCRRFLADNRDFCLDNLKACGIEKFYQNIDLGTCVESVKADLLQILS